MSRTLWSYPPSEVIRQKRNTKTCNKATSSINHPQVSKAKDTEEGSGEITRKAPTPEHDGSTALGQNEGFGETQKEAPTPEPSVREVPSKVRMDMVEQQVYKEKEVAINWAFLVKSHITMRYLLRGKPSSN